METTTHSKLLRAFGVKPKGQGTWANIYPLPDGRSIITGQYEDEMQPVIGSQIIERGRVIEFIPETTGTRIIQVIEESQSRANIIAAILQLKDVATEDPTEHEVIMGAIEKLEALLENE